MVMMCLLCYGVVIFESIKRLVFVLVLVPLSVMTCGVDGLHAHITARTTLTTGTK